MSKKSSVKRFRSALLNSTLAKRLMFGIIPISLAAICVLGSSAYLISKKHIVNNVNKEIDTLGHQAGLALSDFFKQRIHDLETIVETPLLADYHTNLDFGLLQEAKSYRQEMERYLQRFSRRTEVYNRLIYVDGKGREVCKIVSSEIAAERNDLRDPALMQELRTLSPVQHYQSSLKNDPHFGPAVVYAKALFNPAGVFKGILILECSLKPVEDILNGFNMGPSGWAYMAGPTEDFVLGKRPASITPGETLSSETEIPETPWKISVGAKSSEFLGPLKQIRNLTLWTGGLCGALVVLFVVFRVRSVTRPIKELVNAAQDIQTGNLSARVSTQVPDEIGILSQAFNTMAESLEQRTDDLTQSEARYRSVLENSPAAVMGISRENWITTWNRGAEEIFGYSSAEILGKPITALFPPKAEKEFHSLLAKVMEKGGVRDHLIAGVSKKGEHLDLSLSWGGTHQDFWANREWAVVIRNVSEAKKLQQQIIRSEKLSAVGQLLSSVAHELNNPLQAVTGYAQLLSSQLLRPLAHSQNSSREDAKMILESAMRCRKILDNLLLFVRHGDMEKRPVHIREILSASLELLQYKLKKSAQITVKCDIPKRLPGVKADAQQIQQVFVNILNNACDALTTGWDGKKNITIRALAQGETVRVEIADSGPGISEDDKKSIFEPFFTTKPAGRGTGLGLSVSRQIMQDHGGLLGFKSPPGGGTAFYVELPATRTSAVRKKNKTAAPAKIKGWRVLVVDDEPSVLAFLSKFFVREGSLPSEAENLQEAREKISKEVFDVVVADVRLGEGSGLDLRENWFKWSPFPRPPFLFLTGDVLNPGLEKTMEEKSLILLHKPVDLDALLGTLADLLHKDSPSDFSART